MPSLLLGFKCICVSDPIRLIGLNEEEAKFVWFLVGFIFSFIYGVGEFKFIVGFIVFYAVFLIYFNLNIFSNEHVGMFLTAC